MDSRTLIQKIHDLGLWAENQTAQQQVQELGGRLSDVRLLARELLERDLLTPYQANQLLLGKGDGLLVDGYLILERLGEGAMGQVFKARHGRLHRLVALKIFRPEHVTNPVAVGRFLREVRAAAQLAHPNIVRAYDAGQVAGTYYLAMQYLDGRNLSRLVQQEGPLALDRACDYALQTALGLQHIHEHGMVHRDIKPSNLMVTRPSLERGNESNATGLVGPWGQVKILDLGAARLCEEPEETAGKRQPLTKLGTIMGTADYMAPEQAISSKHADIRSDLYSLGCTLYLMLTGQPPFPGGTALEKLMRHQLDEPPAVEKLRPDISPEVRAVLRRLMAKKPEERFQTPHAAAEALAAAAEALRPMEAVPLALGNDHLGPSSASAFLLEDLATARPALITVLRRRRGPDWATLFWAIGGLTAGLFVLFVLLRLLL
jgi:serine/threonine protein kinase